MNKLVTAALAAGLLTGGSVAALAAAHLLQCHQVRPRRGEARAQRLLASQPGRGRRADGVTRQTAAPAARRPPRPDETGTPSWRRGSRRRGRVAVKSRYPPDTLAPVAT